MSYLANKSNIEIFKEFLKDPDRKSLPEISIELLDLLFRYKELPVHYFSRYLFKRQAPDYRNFIPNRLAGKISVRINDHKIKEAIDNKLFFDFFYRQFGIPLPRIIIYNHRNMFVAGKKTAVLNSSQEFQSFLSEVFEKDPSLDSMIIKKTSASSSGKHIYKLFRHQVNTDNDYLKSIFTEVVRSGFLFQKTILQNSVLDTLNPSCLNTIRIDTFINPDGTVENGSAYLRMSISNSCIDNISSGGCQVGIDLDTGRLKKTGYALIQSLGVKLLTEHPVTRIRFENLEIPHFREARELVNNTAKLLPGLRLIGWDVAIGTTGPILIEGNSDYDISGNDLADGGYMANKTFRKVLKETNLHLTD